MKEKFANRTRSTDIGRNLIKMLTATLDYYIAAAFLFHLSCA
jgi:hypothetical protein